MAKLARKSNFALALGFLGVTLGGFTYYMWTFDYNLNSGKGGGGGGGGGGSNGSASIYDLSANGESLHLLPTLVVHNQNGVTAELIVRNVGPKKVTVNDTTRVAVLHKLELKVTPENASTEDVPCLQQQTKPQSYDETYDSVVELLPQAALSRQFALMDYFVLKKPGRYQLIATYFPDGVENARAVRATAEFDWPEKSDSAPERKTPVPPVVPPAPAN